MSASSSGEYPPVTPGPSVLLKRHTAKKRSVTPPPRACFSSEDESDSDDHIRVKEEIFSTDDEYIASASNANPIRIIPSHFQENHGVSCGDRKGRGSLRKGYSKNGKKIGRPRKEVVESIIPKEKKKLGRPRKIFTEPKLKRKRGRPRKDVTINDSPANPIVKKGRPKKKETVTSTDEVLSPTLSPTWKSCPRKSMKANISDTWNESGSESGSQGSDGDVTEDFSGNESTMPYERFDPNDPRLDACVVLEDISNELIKYGLAVPATTKYELSVVSDFVPNQFSDHQSSSEDSVSDFEEEHFSKRSRRPKYDLSSNESSSLDDSNDTSSVQETKSSTSEPRRQKPNGRPRTAPRDPVTGKRIRKKTPRKLPTEPSKTVLLTYLKFEDLGTEKTWNENPFSKECKFCQHSYSNRIVFFTHEPCYSQKRRMREMMFNAPDKEFECEICWAQFDERKEFEKHINGHFDPMFACKLCSVTSNEESEIVKHSSSHDTPQLITCLYPECGKTFDEKNKAMDHVSRAHFANFVNEFPERMDLWKHRRFFGPPPVPPEQDPRILKGGLMCFVEPFIGIRGERESYADMYTVETVDYTCESCKQDFTGNLRNFYSHHPCYKGVSKEKDFLCRGCKIILRKKDDYNKHVSTHSSQRYLCKFCSDITGSEREAIIHTQKHTEESLLVCLYPGCAIDGTYKRLKHEVKIARHIKEKHLEITEMHCQDEDCALLFRSVEERKQHELAMHPKSLITNTTRSQKLLLKDRKKAKVFPKCPIEVPEFEGTAKEKEEKLFEWLSQFVAHNKPKNEIKLDRARHIKVPFEEICKLCNVTFGRKEIFTVHSPCYFVKRSRQLMEEGIEEAARFECEFCQKTFDRIDQLQKHVSIHFDPQYKCNWPGCEHMSKRPDTISNHYDMHIKYFRAKCNIDPEKCQKEFMKEVDVKRHMLRFHLKYNFIQCEHCPERFPHSRLLIAHMRYYHSNNIRKRTFLCPVCSATFVTWNGIRHHFNSKHPEYDYGPYEKSYRDELAAKKLGHVDIVDGEIAFKTDLDLQEMKTPLAQV